MGNIVTRLPKNRPGLVGRQVEVVSREIEKMDKAKAIAEHVNNKLPQTRELGKGDMAKALAGAITSRTEKFVEAEEMQEKVPSKQVNDARKRHRLDTKELCHLVEVMQGNPGTSIQHVCRELQYDVSPERIKKLIDTVALPTIGKSPSGAAVALRESIRKDI